MVLIHGTHKISAAIDFDGTVTPTDVVDGILERYAVDQEWREAEEDWAAGLIGSKDCLSIQLRSVRVSREELSRYLRSVSLDPGFGELKAYLDEQDIPLVILSDGFDLMIREILDANGYSGIPFKANHVDWRGLRLIPSFPYWGKGCGRCAHCKKATLKELKPRAGDWIFIGDGQSDICGLSESRMVFAKDALRDYCDSRQAAYTAFRDLNDVKRGLVETIQEKSR